MAQGDESNKCLLHQRYHDERHAKRVNDIPDKGPIIKKRLYKSRERCFF